MEPDVIPAFPTLIGRLRIPDAEMMNDELQTLMLAEERRYSTLGPSNIRDWHSRPDFLSRRDSSVSALTSWLTCALRRMIDATAGENGFSGVLCTSEWGTICRAGAHRAPHSHPVSAWSGVYCVNPGSDRPISGVLEVLGPRAASEAVTARGDPYGDPFRVRPQAGLLVVLPSWLYQWVRAYEEQTPRITVSFNAALTPAAQQPQFAQEKTGRADSALAS